LTRNSIKKENNDVKEEQDVNMQQLLIDQLNLADVVLMNKTDVLPENDLDSLKDRILSYNSRSQMHVCI